MHGEQDGACSLGHFCPREWTDRGTWDSPPTLRPPGLSQGPSALPPWYLSPHISATVSRLSPDRTTNPGTYQKCVAVCVSGFRTVSSMWEPGPQHAPRRVGHRWMGGTGKQSQGARSAQGGPWAVRVPGSTRTRRKAGGRGRDRPLHPKGRSPRSRLCLPEELRSLAGAQERPGHKPRGARWKPRSGTGGFS